jgi:hypothetical protein
MLLFVPMKLAERSPYGAPPPVIGIEVRRGTVDVKR